MNIIRYSIRSFFTNEYYSIIRFASKRLFVATLIMNINKYGIHVWCSPGQELMWQTFIAKACTNKMRVLA